MRHHTTPSFWECYKHLPESIKRLSNKNFNILKQNPQHPSLHFKKVGKYWSVMVGRKYRSIAVEFENNLLWFWIGSHDEYNKLIKV